ncbi:putative transporter [Prevotella sp. OH937_COT-195]|uniref:putative transporter n=1 Tax=Prevotella sp. OH937_COT-195 TaxID=2491051 RepID=UPI000F64A375|nr:putative transporter [Prevotella sp. OH937_COT-195]RRC97448.1 putative transporter [Prevotella sp. OH937_COT-195]
MDIIAELLTGHGIGQSIFVLALVVTVGVLLSKIKLGGLSLGVTWVLFSGILAGHLGLGIDPMVLSFVKESGMVLFIFGIGMIVGPGFFSTFKQGGIQLNLLSMLSVAFAVVITYLIFYFSGTPIDTMMGIVAGAVTNTPALGAAQEAAKGINGIIPSDIGIGYALAYPVAILGLILTTSTMKWVLRIKVDKESEQIADREKAKRMEALVFSIEVTNPALFDNKVSHVKALLDKHEFIISRILHKETGEIEMAHPESIIKEGDKVLVISEQNDVETICAFIGHKIEMADTQWFKLDHRLISRRCLVTQGDVNGKSIEELKFRTLYNVNISRVLRAGVHLIGKADLRLNMGDTVILVGEENDVKRVEKILGNSASTLRKPNLSVLFVTILVGLIVGSIEIPLGGMPMPAKLGFSGGTLIVAILISNFGTRFKLNTHNTQSVNLMLKEFGITLFLACVGLSVGGSFIEKLLSGGYLWMLYAAAIMMIPLWITTLLGRYWLKLDYFTLLGYVAGNMTFAPALSISPDASKNNIPAVKYATVYPLTLFVRVMVAQLMILLFA